ncbi:MAG: bis(5'-nucleosyl)-tetraphosphatase (symmetrical) YqeK [Clostridia bacterium]|nr:bis(5'-nucleosyl)-tetraphosphatase (symmetrical) YqeK [Clostridia bacterium]
MKFTEKQLDVLRESVKNNAGLSPKRLTHVLAVENAAAKLADLYLPEKKDILRAAALLHDITKEYPVERQVEICLKHGHTPTDTEIASPVIFHAKTAAWLIPELYPEFADDEVVEAVRWHTTGRVGMTMSEKIIYFADYIDDSRTFPDCVTLRNLFWRAEPEKMSREERLRHLNVLIKVSYEMTIKTLEAEGRPIDDCTRAALDAITKEIEKGEKI